MFRETCPIKVEQNELFKTHSGDRSLISCNCFLSDRQVPLFLLFLQVNRGFCTFFAEKKEFSPLGTLGHLCTTFETESLSISPFYLSFVEYQYLILSLRYSWWTKSGKKNLKEGEKKSSTVKRKRILNLSRANVGCDPLISPLDKFSLQAKIFSFETAVMQTHTKITQKKCFASK